jgi:hypothetical protein
VSAPGYPRPERMIEAGGARADGPDLGLRVPSEVERAAAVPGGEARRGDVTFWDGLAQAHKRIVMRRRAR